MANDSALQCYNGLFLLQGYLDAFTDHDCLGVRGLQWMDSKRFVLAVTTAATSDDTYIAGNLVVKLGDSPFPVCIAHASQCYRYRRRDSVSRSRKTVQ